MFELTRDGLALLTEVAPGIDIERDIIAQMGFKPIIAATPRLMDERIFRDSPMGLRDLLLRLDLSERFSYDAEKISSLSILKGTKSLT